MEFEIDDPADITKIKKLDAALDLLRSAEANINGLFNGLNKVISTTRNDFLELENQQNHLEAQKRDLQKKAQKQEQKISGLTNEQEILLSEYAQVKGELEKLTKMASGADNFSFQDMKATLSIYRVLLEEIFQSQPHFKVLHLLHGATDEMHFDQLKGASGIEGAMILRACHELEKVNLVKYDLETKMVKLEKRLFPKKKKETVGKIY